MSTRLTQSDTLYFSDFSRLAVTDGLTTRDFANCIASNQSLKRVYVYEPHVDNMRLIYDALYRHGGIEYLNFQPMRAAKVGLCISRMNNLKEVEFIRVTSDDSEPLNTALIRPNRSLQKFKMEWGNMGDAAAQQLLRILRFRSSLTLIHLGECGLSNNGVADIGRSLQHHSMLVHVIVESEQLFVGDEAAAVFAKGIEMNTSIAKLKFIFRNVALAGWKRIVRALTSNTTLKEADITLVEFDRERSFVTAHLIAANKTLEKLRLSGRRSPLSRSDDGGNLYAPPISDALATNHSLRSFSIHRLRLGPHGINHVCNALVQNDTLEHFALLENEITGDGIRSIGRMVSNNSSLKSLDLSRCRIDGDQAITLCESLKLNHSVASLDLSHNEIGNRGAFALADYVASSQMIKRVDVDNNHIRDEGYAAFGRALKRNVSLEALIFGKVLDRRLTETGIDALLNGVECHPALTYVDILCMGPNVSQKDELEFYVERNKHARPILHANLPLSIWPLVLKRADDCRHVGNHLRAPDMLHYFVKEKTELFTRGPSRRNRTRTSA